MFTTDIIHFLQEFNSPVLFGLMQFISALSLIPFLLLITMGIAFGFDFRKGIVLLNLIAWTALLANFAKESIDYPRPADVDSGIIGRYQENTSIEMNALQPSGFFELFSEELLTQTRGKKVELNGFPSGRTAAQAALWLGIIFLFKKRWSYYIGLSVILLTMISRMYLGANFLGDTLGGILLGILCCIALLSYVKDSKFYLKRTHNFKSLSFLGFPLLLVPFSHYLSPIIIGSILGINSAVILQIQLMNVPVNNGYAMQRIYTALIGVSLFLIGFYLPKFLGFSFSGYLGIFIYFLLSFISFFGALALCRKINLIRS